MEDVHCELRVKSNTNDCFPTIPLSQFGSPSGGVATVEDVHKELQRMGVVCMSAVDTPTGAVCVCVCVYMCVRQALKRDLLCVFESVASCV